MSDHQGLARGVKELVPCVVVVVTVVVATRRAADEIGVGADRKWIVVARRGTSWIAEVQVGRSTVTHSSSESEKIDPRGALGAPSATSPAGTVELTTVTTSEMRKRSAAPATAARTGSSRRTAP